MTFRSGILLVVLLIAATMLPDVGVSAYQSMPQSGFPTDTPSLPYVECCKNNTLQVNLRSGPSSVWYPNIGVLLWGETAPVLGKSAGGSWFQIRYTAVPGGLAWVSADYVILRTGESDLPIVDPPPTPTPQFVATIDPTYAAQFSSLLPTRQPTFTAAPRYSSPTPIVEGLTGGARGFPPAIIVIGLLTLGTFGGLLSAVVGRR